MGEAVLNGGETAALAVIESVARLVPGFMGKEESGDDESFSNGLLEYPHYTRPEVLEGREVPEVLRGGDHGAVARWRRQQSLATTLRVRPTCWTARPWWRKMPAIWPRCPGQGPEGTFLSASCTIPCCWAGKIPAFPL